MAKIGDRRVNNGGWRPGAGAKPKRPPLVYLPDGRVDIVEYCKSIGYDPVLSLQEMAEDDSLAPHLRLQAHREVARYLHHTRAAIAVEHSGKIEGDLSGKSIEELRNILDEYRQKG